MKKLISILAAIAITMTSAVTSFASGFANSIEASTANKNAIDIIYNGALMTYSDATPEIINDRTMLPFRIALENMGAQVNYDDAQRLVTASLNGRTISFTLEDSVIYIDNNGEKSQITLDTPMVIKNDRTLVPVRFISSALGMQVGWDGDTKTVLIVDADTYVNKLEKAAPNLMAMADIEAPSYNTLSGKITAALNLETPAEKANANLDLTIDGKAVDGILSANCKLNLELADFNIKDAAADIVFADGKIYFKTDLFGQLMTDEASKLGAQLFNNDWFYLDIKELTDKFGAGNSGEIYAKALSGEKLSKDDLLSIIKSALATDGDATAQSAQTADMVIDIYSAIDKYITVGENSISVKVDKNAFAEMMKAIVPNDEETKKELDAMDFNMDVTSTFDEKQNEAKGTIGFGVDLGDGGKVNVSIDISATQTVEENATPAAVPTDAVDIMTLFAAMTK